MFKSGVFLTTFGQKLLPFYLFSLIMCESVGKIIARTLCAMHHGILSLCSFFNNDACFLDFRAQKFPLIFFLILILFKFNKPCILGF